MASPTSPATQLIPFTRVALYPLPDASAAVVPDPSSNVQCPTSPDGNVVTVRVVDPLTEPDAAVIVVLPVATPLANPALLMVATLVLVELHVTELVIF